MQPWIDRFRLIEPIEYRFLTLDSLRHLKIDGSETTSRNQSPWKLVDFSFLKENTRYSASKKTVRFKRYMYNNVRMCIHI